MTQCISQYLHLERVIHSLWQVAIFCTIFDELRNINELMKADEMHQVLIDSQLHLILHKQALQTFHVNPERMELTDM